jgi:uncharacterized protein YggE
MKVTDEREDGAGTGIPDTADGVFDNGGRTLRRLAAGLGACAWLALAAPVAQAGEDPRVVVVSGQGEVRAQPDRATVTVGVLARRPTVEAARQEANRVQAALLGVTRSLQIPDAQVRSTRVNVSPEYTWNESKRQREFVAYVVQRQIVVDLRDIEKLGPLMEKSLTAGANDVQEPFLDSTKRKDLEREALVLAVEDARRNADVLARAVGMAVGPARNVQGSGVSPGPPMAMARLDAVAAAAPVESPQTYQSGELVFGASANVTFDLVPAAAR